MKNKKSVKKSEDRKLGRGCSVPTRRGPGRNAGIYGVQNRRYIQKSLL